MKLAKEKTKPQLNVRYLIPSVLTVGFVPLIMRISFYNPHLSQYDWFPDTDTNIDVFLRYKQWAVVAIAAVCIILLLVRKYYYFEELPKEKFMIPAGIYAIFVLLSAIFGKSPLFAFAGSLDMFESALALLSYLVIAYYTYASIVSLEHLLWFLRWSEWFVLVELLIVVFQGFGHDFLLTDFGKRLYTPAQYWDQLDGINAAGGGKYGTLFNGDYFSMYLAVLMPIFVGLFIVETKKWRKAFNAVLFVLGGLVLIHGVASGVVGLAAAAIIGAIVVCSRNRKSLAICLALVAGIAAGVLVAANTVPVVKNKVSSFLGTGSSIADRIPVKSITTGDTDITYVLKDGTAFSIAFDVDQTSGELLLDAHNGDGDVLTPTVIDPGVQSYSLLLDDGQTVFLTKTAVEDYPALYVSAVNVGMTYVKNMDSGYWFLNTAKKLVKLSTEDVVEVVHLFPDDLFTGRGQIYNKCLPLLKDSLVIGSGANTFILRYPQWDYVRDTYLGISGIYTTKPHCFYLQLWIEEGFAALAVLLFFFGLYLVKSIRLYQQVLRRGDVDNAHVSSISADDVCLSRLGFFLFLGILSYLIVVLANDSTICTAPVFWTVLGAGWAVNKLVKANAK